MFKMIGGDGREYGPISPEQLRDWVLEQRANGQTLVQREGSTGWLPLASFPEFAEALKTAWPEQPPLAPPPSPLPLASADDRPFRAAPIATGRVSITACLGQGWGLFCRHFYLLAAACGLVWLISSGTAFVPCAGPFISLAISGPLYGGLALLVLRLIRQREARVADAFAGFGPPFATLLLVGVLTSVVSGLGLLLCLIPGLLLKALWAFALPLAADRSQSAWHAMETSRKAVSAQFPTVVGLLVLAWLPAIVFESYSIVRTATFLLEALGPVSAWTLESLRPQMEPIGEFAVKLELQRQAVFLFNLPFAMAAVLYAYESLFGAERSAAHG
jgi:hypothetical protein